MLPEDSQQIETQFPCRSKELEALRNLTYLPVPSETSPWSAFLPERSRSSSLVVEGGHNTGKTSIIKALGKASADSDHVYIDCKKCITSRSLYEQIIDDICQYQLSIDEDGNVRKEGSIIESLDTFITQLEHALGQADAKDKVIILDHFSVTSYENGMAIMATIVDLLERLQGNNTFVFVISEYDDMHHLAVPTIHFPPYTPEEICHILQQSAPLTMDLTDTNIESDTELIDLWNRFCKTIHQSFHEAIGADLDLYRKIAIKIFPQYIQPIKDNNLSAKNHVQLTRYAQELFLPEPWIIAEESLATVETSAPKEKARVQELSSCSRYLLVAAFLASYNPGKTDRTFFSRGKGEKTKRRGGKNAVNKVTKQPQRLLGPKGFTLERMVSIFQAIVPSTVHRTSLLDQQIADLFSLKLLVRQGNASDLLDDGRWVVSLSYATIAQIAQSVGFELNRFLFSE